ncbi:YjgN family protein [Morganella morganii]|uniref:YjgN family protein n=1 Tax=Morganella morganii TaxID=582 RepID=UPI00339C4807
MNTEKAILSGRSIEKDDIRKTVHDIKFHGRAGEYFKIWIVNFFLTIFTLGLYSAWATVRKRRYFYGNTEIDNSHFDYHALPLNLLLSRIIAIAFITIYVVTGLTHPYLQLICLLVLFIMAPYFILRSWRFNAIMTSFRNIRFSYHCRYGRGYWVILLLPALLVIGLTLLMTLIGAVLSQISTEYSVTAEIVKIAIVMLSVAIGIFVICSVQGKQIYELFFNQLAFGQQKFSTKLHYGKFFKIYGISVLILLPFLYFSGRMMLELASAIAFANYYQMAVSPSVVIINVLSIYLTVLCGLVIMSVYLRVAVLKYILGLISLGDKVTFRSDVTYLSYLSLVITNSLITIFTLGFGVPLAEIRHARYMAEHTKVIGDISLTMVNAHGETKAGAVQDELINAFDLGINL